MPDLGLVNGYYISLYILFEKLICHNLKTCNKISKI